MHRLRCPWSSDAASLPDARYRGAYAELVAASFLRSQGLCILRRNFRWGDRGELDIVARDGDTLVVVEVKSTISPSSGDPGRAISRKKRRLLRLGAHNWLRLLGDRVPDISVRFDIIEVFLSPRERPVLRWHKNAFPLRSDR